MPPELVAMLAVFAVREARSILAENQERSNEEVAKKVASNMMEIMEVLETIKKEREQYGG